MASVDNFRTIPVNSLHFFETSPERIRNRIKQIIQIMRKHLLFLFAVLFAFPAVAQIDNLANLSPEWSRLGSRNAATDAPDIMMYNPAGMAFTEPGLKIGIGNQSYFRKPSHEYDLGLGAMRYEQDGNDLFVPNLNIGYTRDRWSVFGSAYIAGGGATANFPAGSINTDLIIGGLIPAFNAGYMTDYTSGKDVYLEGTSYYLALGIGGAYAVNEKVAFGLMVRNLMARNKTMAGFTLTGSVSGLAPDVPLGIETKDNANGVGVMAGVHLKPTDKLEVAFRYESKVNLEFETTVEQDDLGMFTDGDKSRRDFPAVAAVGFAYQATEKLKVMSDWNYYFQKNADWGMVEIEDPAYFETELSVVAGDAYTFSLSFEYKATEKLAVSLGGVYSKNDIQDRDAYYTSLGAFETVMESNLSICGGFAYDVSDKVQVNLGIFQAIYSEESVKALYYSPLDVDVKINNRVTSVGLGVNFKI